MSGLTAEQLMEDHGLSAGAALLAMTSPDEVTPDLLEAAVVLDQIQRQNNALFGVLEAAEALLEDYGDWLIYHSNGVDRALATAVADAREVLS